MKVSTCRAATAAARYGLNVMSSVTTRLSSGECCHPEGGGAEGDLLIPQVVEIYYQPRG